MWIRIRLYFYNFQNRDQYVCKHIWNSLLFHFFKIDCWPNTDFIEIGLQQIYIMTILRKLMMMPSLRVKAYCWVQSLESSYAFMEFRLHEF